MVRERLAPRDPASVGLTAPSGQGRSGRRGRDARIIAGGADSQEALSSLLGDVLPPQGAWSDREYLWLTDHTNRLLELAGA